MKHKTGNKKNKNIAKNECEMNKFYKITYYKTTSKANRHFCH